MAPSVSDLTVDPLQVSNGDVGPNSGSNVDQHTNGHLNGNRSNGHHNGYVQQVYSLVELD
jgi:hypothetical protein